MADSWAGVAAALVSAAPAPLPWLPQLIRLGAGEEEWLLPLLLPPSPRPGEPGRGGGAGGLPPAVPPFPPPCCKYQGLRNMVAAPFLTLLSSRLFLHPMAEGPQPEKSRDYDRN